MSLSSLPKRTEVAIVGAGQAGLSLSWHLTQRGVDHLLIERQSIAHEWRSGRWDNFTLVTPNWQCRLPGYEYAGPDPDGFMKGPEVAEFVRGYAASFDAPVLEGVEVLGLTPGVGRGDADGEVDGEHEFTVDTSAGTVRARAVVIATGGYHRPVVPAFAERIPATVHQLHSSSYRSSTPLPAGPVLVVGSGQSGAQIAEDLFLEGREVHLAVGGAPRVARFYRGRDCVAWLSDMGVYDIPVGQQAGGLAKREATNHYVTGRDGGRDIDLRRFAAEGMRLYGRLSGLSGSTLLFDPTLERNLDAADAVSESIKDDIDRYIERTGAVAPTEDRYSPVWRPEVEPSTLDLDGIAAIVWAIGYRADYSWVRAGIFDGRGYPTHHRGVTGVDGLFLLGLPWLHTWGSGRFAGIARDAGYLADRIEERRGALPAGAFVAMSAPA